jgi:hypothetical protein
MQPRIEFSWEGARESQDRLAAANERAWRAHLASLTTAESIRIFEELCEGIPELDRERPPLGHPVPLFRLWRP